MTAYIVELTWREIAAGAREGASRQILNLARGIPDGNNGPTCSHCGASLKDWQRDIEGALAELAVAKYLNQYWTGASGKRAPDVGRFVEVKWIHAPDHRLIIQKQNADDRIYILVYGHNGRYHLKGWIYGSQAKRDKFLADPTGKNRQAYFIPQADLYGINLLELAIYERSKKGD